MKQWANGKSLHKFTYTYEDITRLTRLSSSTVRQYAYEKFNPNDSESVIQFVIKYMKI